MYRKKDRDTQMLFKQLMPFGGKLDENNRWLKLRELIPWEELEKEYAGCFSEKMGRPGLDGQLVIGVICIKHMLKLSDEEVMEQVLENPYMQAFCGLENFTTVKLFNESSLSKLRKRLGKEYFRNLEKQVLKMLKERGLIKARGVMMDATVFPSNVRFPTDVSLLNEVREWLVEKISLIGKKVGVKSRTYRRNARNEYLSFSKARKKTKKAVKAAVKAMKQYVGRNIKQLEKLLEIAQKKGLKLQVGISERFETARKIYEQQKEMYENKTHRVKDRIVSFHQPQVRPMVRGKAGKEVEFGPKGSLSLVGEYLLLDELSFDGYNEAAKLKESVERYKERFGKKPKEIIADGIYGNRENRQYMEKEEIKSALRPLGRKARTKEAERHRNWVKKKQKERNRIEGMIGHAKEHFGLDKIRYKIEGGADIWVLMGLTMMNLDTALKKI